MMCFLYKCLRSSIRNHFFLIFGLFLGVGLSAFMSQIVQNNCVFTSHSSALSNLDSQIVNDNDDYEPRINLAGKPAKAQKTPQEFIRPRYYTTELGMREKLFVAVLTSPKTMETYGVSFNKTIHHLVDKVIYFMESEPNKSRSDVRWNGVVQFSDSRLILKPFHVLKYIADNFLEDFDYFYFVRDDTYVRGRNLYELVQSLSVSENVHAGGGKQDAITPFCSIDTGVLLSNLVLQKVIYNLNWCIHNAFSDSDDANLGRCIVHSSGLPCSDGAQGLKLYSFHFSENLNNIEFSKLEKNELFSKALTIRPISNPNEFYKLHIYFSKIDLIKTRLEISGFRHSILNTTVVLPPNNQTMNVTWPVGNQPPNKPGNRFDLLRWDYFNENQIFLKSDFSNVNDLKGADLLDIKNVINSSVRHLESKYEGQLIYKRFLNGYRKFDPSRGMDYIIDLAFKDSTTGSEIHKRVEICKPLGKVELVPIPYVTENTRVNMIVIVDENNRNEVTTFMDNYVNICMEKRDKTFLMLVLLYGAKHPGKGNKDDIYAEVKRQAIKHSDRFKKDSNKIAWLSIKLPDEHVSGRGSHQEQSSVRLNGGILRLVILDLVVKKFSNENLLLICTTNMEIRQDYLNRVRMNAIKEWQVFSPIPFSEFNPIIVYNDDIQRPKELDINKNYGHYDKLNTDHIAFYVRDYRLVRKTIEGLIPIVHADRDIAELEQYFIKQLKKMNIDFNLEKAFTSYSEKYSEEFISKFTKLSLNSVYSMFINHGNLTVLRAVDPGLRLRHVERDCLKTALSEDLLKPILYEDCVEKRNFNAGTRSHLGHFILDSINERNNTH